MLFRWSLVSTVTELRRGIDPFEFNLLQCSSACVYEHGFAQGHDSLLHARATTFEEDEVVLDRTVANKTTHTMYLISLHKQLPTKERLWNLRSDLLLGDIEFRRCIAFIRSLSDTIDLVVDRGTMMVSVLTSTTNSPLDVGWMPGTDTSDLSKTLVRLSWKLLGTPSACDT